MSQHQKKQKYRAKMLVGEQKPTFQESALRRRVVYTLKQELHKLLMEKVYDRISKMYQKLQALDKEAQVTDRKVQWSYLSFVNAIFRAKPLKQVILTMIQ
jgi:hypothetical protein